MIKVPLLMHVLIVVCHASHVKALKLIIYSSGQSVLWDQRAIAYPLFLIPKNIYHAPLIQCTGHDSSRVFLVLQPCLHFCRWVLPQQHHPLWHVMVRMGNKIDA